MLQSMKLATLYFPKQTNKQTKVRKGCDILIHSALSFNYNGFGTKGTSDGVTATKLD